MVEPLDPDTLAFFLERVEDIRAVPRGAHDAQDVRELLEIIDRLARDHARLVALFYPKKTAASVKAGDTD